MHKNNSLANQMSALDYWVSRYIQLGEKPWSGDAENYKTHLGIDENTFDGQVVVDIGCGPIGSLHSFKAKMKFGIDILARSFQPFGINCHDMIYLSAPAEDLPFIDDFADTVISLNAIDHVDDYQGALVEIHRILKPNGLFLCGFNLDHHPTLKEPHLLTENSVLNSLEDLFNIEEIRIIELPEPWKRHAPGGVLVIRGKKIPGRPSIYHKTTLFIIANIKNENSAPEFRDLSYVLKYDAPHKIISERAFACMFVEYNTKKRGWGNRLIHFALISIRNNPKTLFNRGFISISMKAFRSIISDVLLKQSPS